MRLSLFIKFLALISIIVLTSFAQTGEVITYPWTNGMDKYPDAPDGIDVFANGQKINLYSVRANNTHYWGGGSDAASRCDKIPVAMFDFSGEITITITLAVEPLNVVVRPSSKNIIPSVNGNTVSFNISQAGQYSFEYNNDNKNALLIFANPIETFNGTQTLQGGIIHTGEYHVSAGQTLYLQAGAVLRGKVIMNSGGKIVGRGIIDGSHIESWLNIGWQATLPIETYGGSGLEINGITIFDPNAWCVQLQNASNVTIDNLKIISSRANSDGISIQSSDNVRITNCFVRSWDDGIVVKNYTDRNSHDIIVENCVLWTDLAQSMEIGVETNKAAKNGTFNGSPQIYNVTFNNIDVIHSMHKAPISIHNGDNAEIYNIGFTDITIDNYQSGESIDGWNYIIDITNLTGGGMGGDAGWTTEQARGSIRGVTVSNVKILDGIFPNARFDSFEGGSIEDVTVKDVYYRTDRLDLQNSVGANCDVRFEFSPQEEPQPPTSNSNNLIVKNSGSIAFIERNGKININLKAGVYVAELYDLQGRVIGKVDINAIDGMNVIALKTSSKGIFILNVKQAGVSIFRTKIRVTQ